MTTYIIKTIFFGLVACRRLSSSEGAPAGFWEVFCAKPRPRGRCQVQEWRVPAAVPTAAGVQKTETWLGLPKPNYTVLPDNAYLSLGKRLHFRGPTLPVIAVATSEVGPAVLLFVEEVCQVLRFQTNSVPRYQ